MVGAPKNQSDLTSKEFPSLIPLLSRRQLSVFEQPEQVGKFLTLLFLDRATIPVRIACQDLVVEGNLRAATADGRTTSITLLPATQPAEPDPSGSLSLTILFLWLGQTYFIVHQVNSVSSEISLGLPQRIYAIHRRKADRADVRNCSVAGEMNVQETVATGTVTELCGGGIALEMSDQTALVLRPLDQAALVLKWGEGEQLAVGGEVAHLTAKENGLVTIGLRLDRVSDSQTFAKFLTYIQEKRNPQIIPARTDDQYRATWKLVNAALPVDPDYKAHEMMDLWRQCSQGPVQLSEIFLLKKKREFAATISAQWIYSQTWLLHSTATSGGTFTILPVELFQRVNEFFQWDNKCKFSCGMWPSQYRFLKRYYTDFALEDLDRAENHFEQLSVVQFKSWKADPTPRGGRYDVRMMTAADQAEVMSTLRQQCSAVFLEATEMQAGSLGLEQMAARYGLCGLQRRREILVAHYKEKLVSFAVAEIGSVAQQLFGFLNSFRVYLTEHAPRNKEARREIFLALLRETLATYNRFGIGDCFLYSSTPMDQAPTLPAYAQTLHDISFFIFNNARAKAFLRHLERVRWEVEFLQSHRGSLAPTVLDALDYRTQPFRSRKTVRLEEKKGIPDLAAKLRVGREKRWHRAVTTNVDPYGCSIAVASGLTLKPDQGVDLALSLEGRKPLRIRGRVRHCEEKIASGFRKTERGVGIEFTKGQLGQRNLLKAYVFQRRNPLVEPFATDLFGSLVGLLKRSGYFHHFPSVDLDDLIREAETTYSHLDRVSPDLARVTVLHERGDIIGSHAFCRIAPRTWQLHQLAVDERISLYKERLPTKQILQSTFEYLLLDPTVEYMVTYFTDDSPIARTYREASLTHYDETDYTFSPYQMLVLLLPFDRRGNGQPGHECRDATAEECTIVSRYLKEILSSNEFAAYGFDNLSLKQFSATWRARGELFSRKIFVAQNVSGAIDSFAIANAGPAGINLAGLFDNFRIFPLQCATAGEADAELALIRFVADYFNKLGRQLVLFEANETRLSHYKKVPLVDLGKVWRLVVRRKAFMTALQFFLARYGKLEERLLRDTQK